MNKGEGPQKRKGAKFGNTCSVRADWLFISWSMLVDGRKARNSNRGIFFCTGLYVYEVCTVVRGLAII